MSNDSILLTRDGPVATLTLNRPAALNALDGAMMDALVTHTQALASDASVRCVVLNGAGNHFMAGGDIKMFAGQLQSPAEERPARFEPMIDRLHTSIEFIQRMDAPVIASVHGAVAGFGLSLALACDLVVAADNAVFTSAYRHIALTPDGGCTYSLPRLVGLKKAMEIVLLGDRFGAQEALAMGLINRVAPVDQLAATTQKLVDAIVAGPKGALAGAKRLINTSLDQTLSQQLKAEATSFARCTGTPDWAEGITAFVEKRAPKFD